MGIVVCVLIWKKITYTYTNTYTNIIYIITNNYYTNLVLLYHKTCSS